MNAMKNITQSKGQTEDAERLVQFKLKESIVRKVRSRAAALGLNASSGLTQILVEYFATLENPAEKRRAS